MKRFHTHKNHKKHEKDKKHKKHKKHKAQTRDFHSDDFYADIKDKKHKKYGVKQAIFFFLDVFYAHKDAVFFG